MFPHAGEGHLEPFGQLADRGVRSTELFENAAAGGVGERGERSVEAGHVILNHPVQYGPKFPRHARAAARDPRPVEPPARLAMILAAQAGILLSALWLVAKS